MADALPNMLGVLGGLGPMSTVYFYELLTQHTAASCDQDHIDLVISSRASTPDRTAYMLDPGAPDPFGAMAEDAARLVAFGADLLVIPCNTAHYFYDKLCAAVPVPILNMVEQTVLAAKRGGCRTLGVLATTGTVQTGLYQAMCEKHGLACAVPGPEEQALVMRIIYEEIKRGKRADLKAFGAAVDALRRQGVQRVVLGCTELSLIKRDEGLDAFYLDSMEALAYSVITAFGKTPIGFEGL